MNFKYFLTFFFFFLSSSILSVESNLYKFENTEVKILLGEKKDKTINIGLSFEIAKDWKIYWIYPGDSGSPPELSILNKKLYDSITPGWPFPEEEFDNDADLTTRIYKDDIIIENVERVSNKSIIFADRLFKRLDNLYLLS